MSKYSKKYQSFKKKADAITDKMRLLIDKMPDKGDKSEDSQKICLLIALQHLENSITGTAPMDFIESE